MEHVDEVDTVRVSYVEPGIQPTKSSSVGHTGLSIEETSPHHGYDVVDAGSTYQEPTSKLLMPVTQLPYGILGPVCLKLDIKDDLHFRDFRLLGEKMRFSKDVTRNLEQSLNATKQLLQLWSTKSPKATVGRLIEMLKEKDFDRSDVVELLEDWVYGKGKE